MANWYTSDPHFGHDNIIKFCKRPFSSIKEMDQKIILNLAAKVQHDDDLWIVGDFGMSKRDDAYLQGVFSRIPGRKHLIIGNHDDDPVLNLPWTSVSTLIEFTDGTQPFVLCHYPMITWNKARKGAVQLFGHVHNQWRGTGNSINVGVDVWNFQPVQASDITKRAATLPPNKHWSDVEHGAELV